MAILADPQTNARAGRTHHSKFFRHFPDTTLRPARPRRPRPTPRRAAHGPRRRRADVQARLRAGEQGERRRELSHLQVPDAGRGPADRTGGVSTPETPDRWLCGPPPRHRRRPPPQPDRPAVLAALLYYARQGPSCYPSDASLAARDHRHPGTVRRCLKRLEDLGYIRREFVPATPANPTGRLIHLTCTEPDWPRPVSDPPAPVPAYPQPGAHPPPSPAHTHPVR